MTLQIDEKLRNLLKGRVNFSFGKRQHGEIACGDFLEEVINLSQEWIDKEEWKTNPELDTARECRIEMKRHIKDHIDLEDEDKPWFIRDFVWSWMTQQVIVLVVRLIVEHYWDTIESEIKT